MGWSIFLTDAGNYNTDTIFDNKKEVEQAL